MLATAMLVELFPAQSIYAQEEDSPDSQPEQNQLTVSISGPGSALSSLSDQTITPDKPLSVMADNGSEYSLDLNADANAYIQRLSINGYTVPDIPEKATHYLYEDGTMLGDQDVKVYFAAEDTQSTVLKTSPEAQEVYDLNNFTEVAPDDESSPLGQILIDPYWNVSGDQTLQNASGVSTLFLNDKTENISLSGGANIELRADNLIAPGKFQIILPLNDVDYEISDRESFGIAEDDGTKILVNTKSLEAGNYSWLLKFSADPYSVNTDTNMNPIPVNFQTYLVNGNEGWSYRPNLLQIGTGVDTTIEPATSWSGAVVEHQDGKHVGPLISNYTLKNPYAGAPEWFRVRSVSQDVWSPAYCVMPEVEVAFGGNKTEYNLPEWTSQKLNGQQAMTIEVAERLCAGYFYLLNFSEVAMRDYGGNVNNDLATMPRDGDLFRNLFQCFVYRTMGKFLPYRSNIMAGPNTPNWTNFPIGTYSNTGILWGNGYSVSENTPISYETQCKIYNDMVKFYDDNKNKDADFWGGVPLNSYAFSMRFFVQRGFTGGSNIGGMDQAVATFHRIRKIENGKFRIKKEGADNIDSSALDGNKNYSMVGATFDVYKKDGMQKIQTLTVGDDLYTPYTNNLAAGTYIVRETSYGNGYVPSLTPDGKPKEIEVQVKSGVQDLTVSYQNTAVYTPDDFELAGKIDAATNKPVANALFKVEYFKNDVTDNADRTWFVKSNADGKIIVGSELQSFNGQESDPWFTNSNKVAVMPLGWVRITEVQAPDGYLLPAEPSVIGQLVNSNPSSGDQNTVLNATGVKYTVPTFKEEPIKVTIVKVQNGNNTPIPGTVFTHTAPDGKQTDVTTNAEGKIVLSNLAAGTHKLQEKTAADGYAPNKAVITFDVTSGKGVTNWTGLDDANMTVDENKTTITIKNEPKPYSLRIHKRNDLNEPLAGAVFGIFTDKECTKSIEGAADFDTADGKVTGFKTANDGSLTVSLKTGVTYYVKELAAPEGYPLPVDQNGNVHVYTVSATSIPAKNEFIVNVDGKEYTQSADFVTINLDRNNYAVGLKIINKRGSQLPETGYPHWIWPLVVIGLCVAGFWIFDSRKKAHRN